MGGVSLFPDDSSDSGYLSQSDDTSESGQEVKLRLSGDEAYQHLEDRLVIDGVTRRAVTSKTRLAALYKFDSAEVDNRLINALSTSVKPSIPCQLETGDGKCYPPSSQIARTQYYLKVTLTNLYLAPAVRLECNFIKPWAQHLPYLTLVTDFHFNEYSDSGNDKITVFSWTGTKMSFQAGKATCSGFNKIARCEAELGPTEREVIDAFRTFISPNSTHDIILHVKSAISHPAMLTQLDQIKARLPGGGGSLLPSIGGRDYAAFGGHQNTIVISDGGGGLLDPAALMSAEAPHPMVPLPCKNTFASVREASIELAYSAKLADEEVREALRLWSAVEHGAEVQLHGEFPMIAIWYNTFDRLGGRKNEDLRFRLPRDLHCGFLPSQAVKTSGKHFHKLEGFLLSSTSGLRNRPGPPADAAFRITSHTVVDLAGKYEDPEDRSFLVKCTPHFSSFTYNSQLEAVKQLQLTKNQRWWPVLLNQSHEELKLEDPTAGAPASLKARAEKWLRGWKKWNPEQMDIIDNITKAKGGLTLVMGPAATGKTLLQRGIAIYFYSLGYHVLALAPANDNANKIAKDMLEVKKDLNWIDVNFNRLFPGSRDIPIDEMSPRQAAFRKVGHSKGDVLPFTELLHKLEEARSSRGDHQEYGVVESVIRAADDKSLSLYKASREDDVTIAKDVDSWDILRELIAEYREDKLDKTNTKKMEKYRLAYRACKGQVVALNRFMITTTGNVRSKEMLEFWFSLQREYGVPRKGVVVLIDEAAKDVEANVWSGIVCEKWAASVKAVYLFGDDKQLQPTNTSARGETQFNYFSDRLDIALPNRLEEECFPCYRLLEQRRMQKAISAFPNRIVYDGKLRNGPGMDVSIDEQIPGLRQALVDILANGVRFGADATKIRKEITDDDLRRQYLEVYGRRAVYEKSIVVHEHVDAFINKILPPLFDFFRASGRSMRKEVMIICAYNYARSEYERKIREFLKTRTGSTSDDMPRIMSVDSSQGDEAFMVFFDASAQFGDRIGFMANRNRFNVAITRAKGVMWMIGGSMTIRDVGKKPSLMTLYKRELEGAGQVHRF